MFKLKPLSLILITSIVVLFSVSSYAKSDETYSTLRMMVDIMEIINEKYVDDTETKKLALGAVKGVVRTLDPYSQFMDEKDYKDMKTETQGSYGGVGLRITTQSEELTVVTPMPDTPAYFAGILPEDIITKIDDKSTAEMSSDEAVKLMRGNPGTKVTLTIYRPSTKEELVFTIKRKKIKIETVKKQMFEGNIGYIRLSEFNAQSASDIEKMLKELSKDGMTSFILDLRNNPGGLLDSAVNICELFIKQGSIVVSTKGRDKTLEQNYYTQKEPQYPDLPMVILINRGSASASEIVTGTMQDYKRALVVGSNSFGKGSVQTIIPLDGGNALRLTIAKYYLPSGRNITHSDNKKDKKNGIIPDVFVEVSPETEVKLYMQSESDKLPKNKNKNKDKKDEKNKENDKDSDKVKTDKDKKDKIDTDEKVKDEVLETAIKLIKEGKTYPFKVENLKN